jgi:LDH2 family malate/lactate/ureidoglycolate dehydrogenase
VLDPAALAGNEAFAQSMRAWTTHYYTAAGEHGRIPGERAAELRAAAQQDGIEIEDALLTLLVELGRTAGAQFPAV